MTTILGGCDMPNNSSIDMQSAGKRQITGDRGLRTDQGFYPRGPSLFAAEKLLKSEALCHRENYRLIVDARMASFPVGLQAPTRGQQAQEARIVG